MLGKEIEVQTSTEDFPPLDSFYNQKLDTRNQLPDIYKKTTARVSFEVKNHRYLQ